MIALIPQIRNFDMFRDVKLNISIGQLVIHSETAGVNVRLGSSGTETEHEYVIWAYYSHSKSAETYEFDSDHIASALYDLFKGNLAS